MTVDYQVLEFKRSARVTEVDFFSTAPLTLDVTGQEFRNVVEIRINGVKSPEFVVLTPRRALAQVPRSQLGAGVSSVAVLTAAGVNTNKAVVTFVAVVSTGKRAEGIVRLAQNFLKLLFTTPGRDIFSPRLGGGLLRLVGTADSPASLKATGKLAVSAVQGQMIQIQAGDARLARNERLRSATLLSSDFDPQTATLSIRIRLTAVDGSTVDSGVVV